jgi:hypothetical protein
VPESTVSRLFLGGSKNLSFQTIADVAIACGGSLDELVGSVPGQ